MSLPPRRDLQRKFWLLVRAGELRTEAAVTMGLAEHTGRRWFSQVGGVVPAHVQTKRSGRYLSLEEREEIFVGVQRGSSIRIIAKSLGRACRIQVFMQQPSSARVSTRESIRPTSSDR
jgi:Helix-turn-helix domain